VAQLPWYSVPEQSFPPRLRKRRRRRDIDLGSDAVALPSKEQNSEPAQSEQVEESNDSAVQTTSDVETPIPSEPSEADSTHPTTPSSNQPATPTQKSQGSNGHSRTATVPVVPLIPIKPAVPQIPATRSTGTRSVVTTTTDKNITSEHDSVDVQDKQIDGTTASAALPASEQTSTITSLPPKPAPKSWADLVRTQGASKQNNIAPAAPNGTTTPNGPAKGMSSPMSDALQSFIVDSGNKISFIEPRGLVNTGNMCYMNSVFTTCCFGALQDMLT
jgi:ubiquitin carboxyl-terminal hydrolase 10